MLQTIMESRRKLANGTPLIVRRVRDVSDDVDKKFGPPRTEVVATFQKNGKEIPIVTMPVAHIMLQSSQDVFADYVVRMIPFVIADLGQVDKVKLDHQHAKNWKEFATAVARRVAT